MIIQNKGSLRYHCLFIIIGSDSPLSVIFFVLLQVRVQKLSAVSVFHKRKPHNFRCDLLCQIVLRRPQASGKNHNVRTVKGRFNGILHSLLIISHNGLIIQRKSKLRAFFCQIRAVCIYDIAK